MKPSFYLRDKQSVALASVLAALFLTALKLITGIITNSLGILSEAVYSGLDLVAALITLFAYAPQAARLIENSPLDMGRWKPSRRP